MVTVAAGVVTKIADKNELRGYFCVQNLSEVLTDFVYLMQPKEDGSLPTGAEMKDYGITVGGLGWFEMHYTKSSRAKDAWYAYTEMLDGIDVRVGDI